MKPLFDLVLRHVRPPVVESGPFRLLGTILEANPYLGRIVTGRITSGSVKPNQQVKVLDHDGKLIESGRVTKVLAFADLSAPRWKRRQPETSSQSRACRMRPSR
jgi:GTP-binding protein